MSHLDQWDRQTIEGEMIFLHCPPGAPIFQGGNQEIHYSFLPDQAASFLRIQLEQTPAPCVFAIHAVQLVAEKIFEAEQSNDVILRSILWAALTENRILDLAVARQLLHFVGHKQPTSAAAKYSDLVNQAVVIAQALQQTTEYYETQDKAQKWGFLALGLNVAASVVARLIELRTRPLHQDKRSKLLDRCETRARRLIELLKGFDHRLVNRLGSLPQAVLSPPPHIKKWVDESRSRLRDAQNVSMGAFFPKDIFEEEDVENWPEWAWGVSGLPYWAILRRVCRLWSMLAAQTEESRLFSFDVFPRLRPRLMGLESLNSPGIDDIWTPRPGFVVAKIECKNLLVSTLAQLLVHENLTIGLVDQLSAKNSLLIDLAADLIGESIEETKRKFPKGIESDKENLFAETFLELVSSGIGTDGVVDLVQAITDGPKISGPVARYKQLTNSLLPELGRYLRDRSFELMDRYFAIEDGASAEAFPMTSASKIAECFAKPSNRFLPDTTFDPKNWASRCTDEVRRRVKRLDAMEGREAYRILFGERVESPSGEIRTRLLWMEARFESVKCIMDDFFKMFLVKLEDAGYYVVAMERNSIFVELPVDCQVDHPQRITQLGERSALECFPNVSMNSTFQFHFQTN